MNARRLLPAVLGAAVLAAAHLPGAAGAAAAPRDVPTEQADRVRDAIPAGDYEELDSRRCQYATADDAVEVDCRADGTLWAEYEFDVPAAAINLRAGLGRTFDDDSAGRYARADGARTGRTTYRVTVSVARGTTVRLDEVRLRYDLPTVVDDRACVTPGEWQAVNVAKGGSGGTLRRVATVFDHRGVVEERSDWTSGYRYQVRSYPRCDSGRSVRITFHQYRGQQGWHSYWG